MKCCFLLPFLAFLWGVFPAVCRAEEAPNLLKNHSFEALTEKGGPADWEFGDFKTGGQGVCEKRGRDGGAALGEQIEGLSKALQAK